MIFPMELFNGFGQVTDRVDGRLRQQSIPRSVVGLPHSNQRHTRLQTGWARSNPLHEAVIDRPEPHPLGYTADPHLPSQGPSLYSLGLGRTNVAHDLPQKKDPGLDAARVRSSFPIFPTVSTPSALGIYPESRTSKSSRWDCLRPSKSSAI